MIALFIMSTVKVGYGWEFIGNHLFKFYTATGLTLIIDLHFIGFYLVGLHAFFEPI